MAVGCVSLGSFDKLRNRLQKIRMLLTWSPWQIFSMRPSLVGRRFMAASAAFCTIQGWNFMSVALYASCDTGQHLSSFPISASIQTFDFSTFIINHSHSMDISWKSKGWQFRLFQTSRWHQNICSVLVYVVNVHSNATFVLVSTGGWEQPEWSPCTADCLQRSAKVFFLGCVTRPLHQEASHAT